MVVGRMTVFRRSGGATRGHRAKSWKSKRKKQKRDERRGGDRRRPRYEIIVLLLFHLLYPLASAVGTSQLLRPNDDSPSGNADRSSVDGCVGRYVPTTIVRHHTVRTSSRATLLLFPSKWHAQGSVVRGLTSTHQAPAGTGHARGQVHALWLTGQSVHPVR